MICSFVGPASVTYMIWSWRGRMGIKQINCRECGVSGLTTGVDDVKVIASTRSTGSSEDILRHGDVAAASAVATLHHHLQRTPGLTVCDTTRGRQPHATWQHFIITSREHRAWQSVTQPEDVNHTRHDNTSSPPENTGPDSLWHNQRTSTTCDMTTLHHHLQRTAGLTVCDTTRGRQPHATWQHFITSREHRAWQSVTQPEDVNHMRHDNTSSSPPENSGPDSLWHNQRTSTTRDMTTLHHLQRTPGLTVCDTTRGRQPHATWQHFIITSREQRAWQSVTQPEDVNHTRHDNTSSPPENSGPDSLWHNQMTSTTRDTTTLHHHLQRTPGLTVCDTTRGRQPHATRQHFIITSREHRAWQSVTQPEDVNHTRHDNTSSSPPENTGPDSLWHNQRTSTTRDMTTLHHHLQRTAGLTVCDTTRGRQPHATWQHFIITSREQRAWQSVTQPEDINHTRHDNTTDISLLHWVSQKICSHCRVQVRI